MMEGGRIGIMDILPCILLSAFYIPTTSGDFKLTLLHTNDVHARFDEMSKYGGPCRAKDASEGKCYGGVARRMTMVRHFRDTRDNVLLLDAGDQFQGTLWYYIHKGMAAAHTMNLLKYDVMTLGNHEFDNGIQGVLPFLKAVGFPVLCCNIDTTKEPSIGSSITANTILEVGGRRVGVIGYITKDTEHLAFPGSLIFLDEIESIRHQVRILRSAGVDVIIALGHGGYGLDLDIARQVEGIDVIIGGHTNTFLYNGDSPSSEEPEATYPTVVTNPKGKPVLVVQNYAFGKYLGHIDLTLDGRGEIKSWNGNPILLDNSVAKDAAVMEDLSEWRAPVNHIINEVVGRTDVSLDGLNESCRLKECSMGNVVADGMLYFHSSHTDRPLSHAALISGGSVRSSLPAGPVTLGDLQSVQPFGNTVDVVEMRGRHIRLMLEHSVAEYDVIAKHGRFLQMSGIRVLYDISAPSGQRVKSICITSPSTKEAYEHLADDTIYRVVVTSYMVKGGDGYAMIDEHALKIDIFESLDLEVTMDYYKKHSPITTKTDGRISFTKNQDDQLKCEAEVAAIYNNGNRFVFRYILFAIAMISFYLTQP